MTSPSDEVCFGPFRLELESGGLHCGGARVPLQRRPLAVLRYLARHAGRVVSGDELLREVWAGTVVTRGVLKVAVRAVREALGEDADRPRYLETVGREGYRFLGAAPLASAEAEPARAGRMRAMVGRDAELDALRAAFGESRTGARRIVLIAGEAGIGKTTLVEHLLREIEGRPDVHVARGQCLERFGEGEPYLPVLEALGRGIAESDAAWLAGALRSHAPSWVAHLAPIAGSAEEDAEEPATPERMLRELADALAVATRERCLVLALEDLHWCDRATLDLLSCLAQRREPARLLVLGTYRPSDVLVQGHPLRDLKQQLVAKSLCTERALGSLGADDVAEYLRRELGESAALAPLAGALHARTAGNPLFMTSAVDDLQSGELLVQGTDGWRLAGSVAEATATVPAGVRQLIEQQAERLTPEDLRLLEAASAAGTEFEVASVAAALACDPDDAETRCETLVARGQFIEPAGLAEWQDGTLCGRYRFRHPLRCDVLYQRVAEARRVRFHRAIAERAEAGHGARASEIAAELAAHFERAHDSTRAVVHLEAAGRTALRRHAPREAVAHFEHALRLLQSLPTTRARYESELRVRVALAAPLMAVLGYAAAPVGESYERARMLCESLGAERELLPVLRGLASYHQVRAELGVAHALGEELLERSAQADDPVARVQAHYGHGVTLFHAGQPVEARFHLERALALYRPEQHVDHVRVYGGWEPSVACRLWLAWTLRVLGYAEQCRTLASQALALAEQQGHPLTRTFARYGVALTHQMLGEWKEALRYAESAIALAEEHGFAYELSMARILHGWALTLESRATQGLEELRSGIESYTATGARLAASYGIQLAAAEAMAGQLERAAARVRQVLKASAGRDGELEGAELRCGAARILLDLAATKPAGERAQLEREAEALLGDALELARAQRAPLLELIAANGLARQWAAHGRRSEARELLSGVLGRFAEGHETRAQRQAARLLGELS